MVTNDSGREFMGWSVFTTAYREVMELEPDPRIKDWLFMSSPWPTIYLSLVYVILVKVVGPRVMRNRPPFDLRQILVIYNGLQVIFSAWLFSMAIGPDGWLGKYSFTCQPVDYSYSESAMAMAAGCWWYFFSKFTEFFDTFFFVLRKKDKHISFLHAFHHGVMPIGTWLVIRYAPGGHSTFPGMLNTLVHVIMYTYYMIAALGPAYEKFIWWKTYLTQIQMVQFTLVAVHSAQLFFFSCDYPKAFALICFLNAIVFLSLFSNFYIKSYRKGRIIKQTKNNLNGDISAITKEGISETKLKSG